MARFYGNRAQSAARARREEQARKEREQYEKDTREAAKWEKAEGPLPEDVWENSDIVSSFGRDMNGIITNHVRTYKGESNGFYLQYAYFPGWRFCVCVPKP